MNITHLKLISTSYMYDILLCRLMIITSVENQLLDRYSDMIVSIVRMLFKHNWSIFTSVLKPINNNENKDFMV